MSILQWHYHM